MNCENFEHFKSSPRPVNFFPAFLRDSSQQSVLTWNEITKMKKDHQQQQQKRKLCFWPRGRKAITRWRNHNFLNFSFTPTVDGVVLSTLFFMSRPTFFPSFLLCIFRKNEYVLKCVTLCNRKQLKNYFQWHLGRDKKAIKCRAKGFCYFHRTPMEKLNKQVNPIQLSM